MRKTAYNSTLAIGGVSSPLDSFVVAESSVLRTNICAEKPAHRQSAKRYMLASRKFCGRRNSRWKKPKKVAFKTNLSESEQGIR